MVKKIIMTLLLIINQRGAMSGKEKIIKLIKKAGEKWPTTFVARQQVSKFTGGVYTIQTMANLDGMGEGPDGAFRIGRQVVYPVDNLCDWLISRAKEIREI
jgi:hypothetical protein